jgi:hypothetical protein
MRTRKTPWTPKNMVTPPALPALAPSPLGASVPALAPRATPPQPRYALMINPFYPKDPQASFGKHVLTPTLALTSVAATTPAHWEVRYWDENLLQGPPPNNPVPQVVGITVHLTFARRAFELAAWFRAQGSIVIMGGLHVLSCPDEVLPHADAIAMGDGVQLWPKILEDIERGSLQRTYSADYKRPYTADPPARRAILPRNAFLTTTSVIATRGCHNRCGFCYLATDGLHMPYRMRTPEQVAEEIQADGQPYKRRAQEDARAGRLRAPGRHPSPLRHPGERQLRAGLRPRRARCLRAHRGVDRREPARVRHVSHPHALPRHTST